MGAVNLTLGYLLIIIYFFFINSIFVMKIKNNSKLTDNLWIK